MKNRSSFKQGGYGRPLSLPKLKLNPITLSIREVTHLVEEAIRRRQVLSVTYLHADRSTIVERTIAPFDIGSTNPDPKIRAKNAGNVYAFCFDHVEAKTKRPKPQVLPFKLANFVKMDPNGDHFDETRLAAEHMAASGDRFDYRIYRFAFLPDRDWFR